MPFAVMARPVGFEPTTLGFEGGRGGGQDRSSPVDTEHMHLSGHPDSRVSRLRCLFALPFRVEASEAALNSYLRALADGFAERAVHLSRPTTSPAS
jgi:hypothetical protein